MSRLLQLDLAGLWHNPFGLTVPDVACQGGLLDKLRDELCLIDEKILAGTIACPPSKRPLHNGFVWLPQRALAEYERLRPDSSLGTMLSRTKHLMSEVDRIVVVGHQDALRGPQALMQACCQPYFNELTRGQRGSRPRMYFVNEHSDNDSLQGLLYLLGAHRARPASELAECWGLVVLAIDSAPPSLLRPLLTELLVNCGGDQARCAARVLWVAGAEASQPDLSGYPGFEHRFTLPTAISARFSILSLAGLLPAALLGINVMQLLEGACAVGHHFQSSSAAENLPLQWAACNQLVHRQTSTNLRYWRAWNQALLGLGQWYQGLLRDCLGQELSLLAATPGSGTPPHPPGLTSPIPPAALLQQIHSRDFRFDALPMDLAPSIAGPTSPPLLRPAHTLVASQQADFEAFQVELQQAQQPTLRLSLSRVDEPQVGQLVQLLMLATVIEGRMMGINPYA